MRQDVRQCFLPTALVLAIFQKQRKDVIGREDTGGRHGRQMLLDGQSRRGNPELRGPIQSQTLVAIAIDQAADNVNLVRIQSRQGGFRITC